MCRTDSNRVAPKQSIKFLQRSFSALLVLVAVVVVVDAVVVVAAAAVTVVVVVGVVAALAFPSDMKAGASSQSPSHRWRRSSALRPTQFSA